MIILMVRMIILMGQDDGFPTPPDPTPPQMVFSKFTERSQLLGVPSYWAFPMAWRRRRRQAMAQRHLAMAWHRRQATGTSHWERPVTGNAQ